MSGFAGQRKESVEFMEGYGRGIREGWGSAGDGIGEGGSSQAGAGRVVSRGEVGEGWELAGARAVCEERGSGGVRRSRIWLGEIKQGGGEGDGEGGFDGGRKARS